jgi:hypothetical protein
VDIAVGTPTVGTLTVGTAAEEDLVPHSMIKRGPSRGWPLCLDSSTAINTTHHAATQGTDLQQTTNLVTTLELNQDRCMGMRKTMVPISVSTEAMATHTTPVGTVDTEEYRRRNGHGTRLHRTIPHLADVRVHLASHLLVGDLQLSHQHMASKGRVDLCLRMQLVAINTDKDWPQLDSSNIHEEVINHEVGLLVVSCVCLERC